MYSFEGDFRRKPEQDLSGASIQQEREELIHRVQNERHKREEIRKRHNSTIRIQAFVRSYLTRIHHKRLQRLQFDEILKSSSKNLDDTTLAVLVQKLIFFYMHEEDGLRLVAISQLLLKCHDNIITAAECPGNPWGWRLRCIIHMNLASMSATVRRGGLESLAIPLRTLEVYTSWDNCHRVLGKEKASSLLVGLFTWLIHQGYFQHTRFLIDNKVPPLLESSPAPPTALSACLLNMILQTLQHNLISHSYEYSELVLNDLCQHILAPRFSEPIHLFIIPALAQLPDFPFHRLLESLRNSCGTTVPPTTWMLFAVLSFGEKHFVVDETGKSNMLLSYLQVIASLSENFIKVSAGVKSDQSDEDSDEEMEQRFSNTDELRVLMQCVNMLNDMSRVHNLLVALDQSEDQYVLQALCQVCHFLLVSNKGAIQSYKLLYMLAFKPAFLRHLWSAILSVNQTSLFGSATPLLHVISRGIPVTPDAAERIVPLLAVFCALFSLLIETLHDSEFYNDDNLPGGTLQTMPFSLEDLVPLSLTLKEVSLGLVELAFPDSRPMVKDDYRSAVHGPRQLPISQQVTQIWAHLFKVTVGLVRQLHSRDIRRQFCPEDHWICRQVFIPLESPADLSLRRHRMRNYRPFRELRAFTREELEEGPPLSTKEVRTMTILRQLPFLVAFQARVLVFQNLVMRDKLEHQGERAQFLMGPSIKLAVRRDYLYEDAFDKLSLENEPELRLRMRVQLVNQAGMDEAGVDGGGIFREFLSELLKTSFDPNRGFFKITTDNRLYPNPNVHLLVDNFPKHYFFIGRMLGKALYENLLVELPFAEFFLSKLVGRHSSVDVHHLDSLDPLLYRNLLFLKSYEGDVTELGLDFTILNDELGETRSEELKPGGANINVTSKNRIEYIHLMADYKLNRQIRSQCAAFKQGLAAVIPLEWLQMFNNKELQVLISGAQIPVDVDDLKQHTNYTGGYAAEHPTIKLFWRAVESFNDIQRRQLLKFVTSCSRPPLLGFKELDPPFCIQHAGTIDRLPTASTCMNLLKLPEFPDESLLSEKLLYAIQAGAGFELS